MLRGPGVLGRDLQNKNNDVFCCDGTGTTLPNTMWGLTTSGSMSDAMWRGYPLRQCLVINTTSSDNCTGTTPTTTTSSLQKTPSSFSALHRSLCRAKSALNLLSHDGCLQIRQLLRHPPRRLLGEPKCERVGRRTFFPAAHATLW